MNKHPAAVAVFGGNSVVKEGSMEAKTTDKLERDSPRPRKIRRPTKTWRDTGRQCNCSSANRGFALNELGSAQGLAHNHVLATEIEPPDYQSMQ